MHGRIWRAALGILGVLVVGSVIRGAYKVEQPSRRAADSTDPSRGRVAESGTPDDLEFYEARAAQDPYGARDRAVLASLYLSRGRSTGSEDDLARAVTLARASAALRSRRNEGTARILAAALMARHEFAEASAVMHRELAGDSTDLIHRATLGEIALELGRYDEADRLFQSVALARFQPDIGVRYARWLEVNGRSAEALALFETIRARQAGAFRVPAEHLAWLDLRIGEMAARNGRPGLARSAWRRGLTLLPDDPRLLRALARLGADLGSWPDAIRLGEASLARAFDPATLVLLSEAYAAAGDSRRATECGHAFEVSISNAPERMHRDWALFALDHARNVDRVLSIARQDLRGRRDIYGFDLAAWALYRSGRPAEARTYADSAVSRGTRDPGLLYRAGRIALAAGDSAMARARLSRALETNPRFHAVLADSARRLLRALGEGS